MKKALGGLMLLSMLGLVQCGGADAGPATEFSAEDTVGDTTKPFPIIKTEARTLDLSATALTGISIDAGYAGNGTTINTPSEFTIDQCRFTAAISQVDGSALSTRVSVNTETGEVICEKVVQEREEVPPETKDCVAAFTIICVK